MTGNLQTSWKKGDPQLNYVQRAGKPLAEKGICCHVKKLASDAEVGPVLTISEKYGNLVVSFLTFKADEKTN